MPSPALRPLLSAHRSAPILKAAGALADGAMGGAGCRSAVRQAARGHRAAPSTSRPLPSVPISRHSGSSTYGKAGGAAAAATLAAALLAGTVSGGALLMQDRDPLDSTDLRPSFSASPTRPHRLSFASSRSQWSALHRRLSTDASTATSASADDVFEDAEETLDSWPASASTSAGASPRAARSRSSVRERRRSTSARDGMSALEAIPDRSPPFPTVRRLSAPLREAEPVIRYGYARGDPDQAVTGEVELDEQEEASLTDEDRRGTTVSLKPQYRRAWQGDETLKAPSPHAIVLPDVDSLDISLELLTVDGDSVASSYSPSGRFPSIYNLAEVSKAPVESLYSPPTSSSTDENLAPTPALSSARSASPNLSIPCTPTFFDSDGSPSAIVSSPTASNATSTFTGPSGTPSSVRPPLSPSAVSPLNEAPPRRASGEPAARRRSSGGMSTSKSARRLSTILTSGFGFGRSRTSTALSTEADESTPSPRETRRRPRTSEGAASRSAPLLSVPSFPFPTQSPSPQRLASRSPSPTRHSRSPNPSSLIRSPTDGRTWRSTFSPETFQRLSLEYGTSEMRRQEVIFELCETERAFVAGLRGVVDLFVMPLRTRSGAWIKNVPPPVARLLDWLDEIVRLHAELSAALDAAQDAQGAVVLRVADAFAPFVPRLEVHQPYLVRFEAVSALIEELAAGRVPAQGHDHRGRVHVHIHEHDTGAHEREKELGSFGEFVRMQSRRPECGGLSLASFLLKPVQRLMKYPLFFRQLCDLTPPGHPDHAATHALHRATDAMILALQEVKAREDEYSALKLLTARTRGLPEGFRLARRDRRLGLQGPLRQVHLAERDRAALDAAGEADPRRPVSTASDSGSSLASAGSAALTWGGGSDSSGWTSPPTPGSLTGPSSPPSWARALPPPGLTPEVRRPAAAPPQQQQARLRTRAKESSVLAWVFSDVLLLAQPGAGGKRDELPRVLKSAKVLDREKAKNGREQVRALEGTGVVRVVGVTDLSGRTEHDFLVQVDVTPILGKGQPVSSATLRTVSLYFTLPSPPAVSSPRTTTATGTAREQSAQWAAWLCALAAPLAHHTAQARRQSFSDQPQLLNAYNAPVTTAERRSSGLFAAAASTGRSGTAARDEGEWWAGRLATVRREMDDAARAREAEERARRSGASFPPVWEDERARSTAAAREKPPAPYSPTAFAPDGKNAGLGIDSLAFRMKEAVVNGGRRMSG
ncbi:hypothetical protein JCM10450v2_004456 [Rhodotorula kratochvilovae]